MAPLTIDNMTGPGLLFANSKISRTDILPITNFKKWYWEEHIPDVTRTSGVAQGSFYENTDEKADKPYLALYPLEDMAFLKSDEFKTIKVHSDLLPGTGLCYDLADIDIRYYQMVQDFSPKGAKFGQGGGMMVVTVTLGEDTTPEEFDDYYTQQHLKELSEIPGYLRTSRYVLTFARSNAQSKILKGLATEEEKKAKIPEPPTYLALHEFDSIDLRWDLLKPTAETPEAKKIFGGAKFVEFPIFGLKHLDTGK